ncbi:MAG: TonB-dependent receptor [Opitutaceae bacterium]|nr:TonB-dependent receptor [Opitutaceae bacterium]
MNARLFTTTGLRRLALVSGVAALSAAGLRADTGVAAPTAPTAPDAADEAAIDREEIVVSASRSRNDPKYTASSVTLVSLAELDESQVVELQAALGREPGVAVVSTGATGSQSSIFMRGGSSHQTLLFVDGVRMNDRAASYVNFLGGAGVDGLGRLEVLRGPQSGLYGSSAMGGVIAMDTLPVGDGPAHGRVMAGGGSFGTWGAGLEGRGGLGALGYSASVGYGETDNDRPGNAYDAWSYAGRVEFAPADSPLVLGGTFRRQDGTYEEPGSTQSPFPGVVDSANTLGTAFAEVRPSDGFSSRLTAAVHKRDYAFTSAFGTSGTENRREILDWLNTWSVSEQVELVGGANYERSRYEVGTDTTRDEVAAGFASAIYRPMRTLTLTASGRLDDFDSFGSAATGRLGAAWNATDSTKLRATFGNGFSAPGSDDRFGVPQWGQLPNDTLQAEEVEGWDIGVDQALRGGDITLGLTWFRHDYRNLFEWEYVNFETFEGMTVNRARARTEGVETSIDARITASVKARLGYTYLDARNETDDVRLVRRPRHVLDAEVTTRPASAWTIGAGLHLVADRVESGGTELEDYTTVRLFTSYRAAEDILLKLRVENLFDAEYEEVLGYPALPIGVFAGVEWAF